MVIGYRLFVIGRGPEQDRVSIVPIILKPNEQLTTNNDQRTTNNEFQLIQTPHPSPHSLWRLPLPGLLPNALPK